MSSNPLDDIVGFTMAAYPDADEQFTTRITRVRLRRDELDRNPAPTRMLGILNTHLEAAIAEQMADVNLMLHDPEEYRRLCNERAKEAKAARDKAVEAELERLTEEYGTDPHGYWIAISEDFVGEGHEVYDASTLRELAEIIVDHSIEDIHWCGHSHEKDQA